MVLVARTIVVLLALGLLVAGTLSARAQGAYSQLVITTKVASGGTLPTTLPAVVVTAAGPSLTGTPSNMGTLTFTSAFNNNSQIVTFIPSIYSVQVAATSGYSYSYSSGCFGTAFAGEVKTCTITAYTGGIATVDVFVQVTNNSGGSRVPADFKVQVAGLNPAPAVFQGASTGNAVTLYSGSYAIDILDLFGSYTKSSSPGCSGTIQTGERRTCIISLDDRGSVLGTSATRLQCSPARQSATIGSTVTMTALGGGPAFSWATADRTYTNAGRTVNIILQNAGTQSVIVSSGVETAVCLVDVYPAGATTLPSAPQNPPVSSGGGVVLGTQTPTPGIPNTGFGPNPLGVAVAIAFVSALALLAFPYVRKTAPSLRG